MFEDFIHWPGNGAIELRTLDRLERANFFMLPPVLKMNKWILVLMIKEFIFWQKRINVMEDLRVLTKSMRTGWLC